MKRTDEAVLHVGRPHCFFFSPFRLPAAGEEFIHSRNTGPRRVLVGRHNSTTSQRPQAGRTLGNSSTTAELSFFF